MLRKKATPFTGLMVKLMQRSSFTKANIPHLPIYELDPFLPHLLRGFELHGPIWLLESEISVVIFLPGQEHLATRPGFSLKILSVL